METSHTTPDPTANRRLTPDDPKLDLDSVLKLARTLPSELLMYALAGILGGVSVALFVVGKLKWIADPHTALAETLVYLSVGVTAALWVVAVRMQDRHKRKLEATEREYIEATLHARLSEHGHKIEAAKEALSVSAPDRLAVLLTGAKINQTSSGTLRVEYSIIVVSPTAVQHVVSLCNGRLYVDTVRGCEPILLASMPSVDMQFDETDVAAQRQDAVSMEHDQIPSRLREMLAREDCLRISMEIETFVATNHGRTTPVRINQSYVTLVAEGFRELGVK
jgi:hypothetical protein